MDALQTDSSKPQIPYTAGRKFTVREHIPPPPKPVTSESLVSSEDDERERMRLSPLERCLRHPPLSGSTGSFSVNMEVIRPLRIGDNHNAQVLVIRLLDSSAPLQSLGLEKDNCIVAKIYDPLYYSDDDGYLNPFLCADKDYTHEAAAYTALCDLRGSKIPKYYGAFTLDIPVQQSITRRARLILIEFISGLSLTAAQPEDFPQSTRQQIMKMVVDFESFLYAQDIVHLDIHPRNILLTDALEPNSEEEPNVIFIDFADVSFSRSAFYFGDSDAELFFPKTYISPLLRWHVANLRHSVFEDWIDWDWQSWLEEEYRDTAASVTTPMRELFLPQSLLEREHERQQRQQRHNSHASMITAV